MYKTIHEVVQHPGEPTIKLLVSYRHKLGTKEIELVKVFGNHVDKSLHLPKKQVPTGASERKVVETFMDHPGVQVRRTTFYYYKPLPPEDSERLAKVLLDHITKTLR